MLYCELCGKPAGMRVKLRDPRRDDDEEQAWVQRIACSEECSAAMQGDLNYQANYIHLEVSR